jgi:hypothetical protein
LSFQRLDWVEQVARVFRNPEAVPPAPQNLLLSFEITCRSDVLRKPKYRGSVESFFEPKSQETAKKAGCSCKAQRVDQ